MSLRSIQLILFVSVFSIVSRTAVAQELTARELAEEYASCAAYYLMLSKADTKLAKYAQFGVAAADNAGRLTNPDEALAMMGQETKRLLKMMDHDWNNAAVIIESKAEPCKDLMTLSE
ncbi:MAG: hypothetical protein AAF387_01810 [Pseudomonadota bacterium]